MIEGLEFDHVGIPSDERRPDENLVEKTRVWVTNPREHPHRIEYLRFEPDSPVPPIVRELPHVAWRVPPGTLREWTSRYRVVLEPWESQPGFAWVSFVEVGGGLVEFMEFSGNPEQWYPET